MFNPDYTPAIYSGSKIWHNTKWVEMRDKYGFNVVAHWINFPCGTKENPTGAKLFGPAEKRELWARCESDMRLSDMAIFYGEKGDIQRGGLVEFGMAIMVGLPTYAIGSCEGFEAVSHSDAAYMHHPLVQRIHTNLNPDGSYDYVTGYKTAVEHYLKFYHTPNRFFERTRFLNASPSRGIHGFQQKATTA